MKPNPVGSSGVASTSLSVTSQSTIAKPQTPGIGPLDSRNPNSLSAVSHSEALGIKQLIGNEMLVGPGTTPSITPRISMEGTFMMQGNGKKKGSGRPKSAQ